jgi:anaerobic dimethyl sulfoxide reductase subunit B (iron-sulfur subunit)
MRAMEWGDIEELKARHPEAVFPVTPLAEPEDFEPNALFNQHVKAKDRTGEILNQEEI